MPFSSGSLSAAHLACRNWQSCMLSWTLLLLTSASAIALPGLLGLAQLPGFAWALLSVLHCALCSGGMVQVCGSWHIPPRACAPGLCSCALSLKGVPPCSVSLSSWVHRPCGISLWLECMAVQTSKCLIQAGKMSVYQKLLIIFHYAKMLLKKGTRQFCFQETKQCPYIDFKTKYSTAGAVALIINTHFDLGLSSVRTAFAGIVV